MSSDNFENLKTILFNDFCQIRKMQCSDKIKIKLLSTLFSANPNCWRVVGITIAALEVFASHNFQRVSGMGVNRSHIHQRSAIYKEMLSMDFAGSDDFWDHYYKHDYTILATSTENMQDRIIESNAYPVPQDERMLFRTRGYSWKHGDEEEYFLVELYKKESR